MPEIKKYFADIVQAGELIESFLTGVESFGKFQSDPKTKSAVERQLMIIGEAVSKIRKQEPTKIESADQIVALRNRIVHSYDGIDDAIIWSIVKSQLPSLVQEAKKNL